MEQLLTILCGHVAGHRARRDHRPKLCSLRSLLVFVAEGCICLFQLAMNPFPADPEDGFIVRDDVPRCRAGITVPMIVEPLHGGSGTGASVDLCVALFEFLLRPAAAGLYVEACARQQVSRQDLVWHVVHHDFAVEPCASLRQGPGPELLLEWNGARSLADRAAKSLEERICLRYDIVGDLVILDIPRGAGGPARVFVVPRAGDAPEEVVSQPLDAWRESLRFLDME